MSISKTSIAVLAAIGLAAAATSASACEWHNTQVHANASTPAAEEQAQTSATPIDPVVLARIEAHDDSEQPEQK